MVYALVLLLFAFTIIPNNDSYYYWGWSRHLQLSYFDGPPMIAYAIKLATLAFGNSVFAINCVGVVVALITTYVIVVIVNLLGVNKKFALGAGLLWLTYPFVATRYILVDVTYDCLVNLFDLTTLLFALRYIKYRKVDNIYFMGVFAGLGLLSKYSSIVMSVTVIGYFIYNKELRQVFNRRHIYVAVLICVAIFMPVLIWNYQHDFASFLFQLKYHAWASQAKVSSTNNRPLLGRIWYYLGTGVLGPMVIYWVLAIFLLIKNKCMDLNRRRNEANVNAQFMVKNHCVNLENINLKGSKSNSNLAINLIFTQMIAIFVFWLLICPFAMVDLIYLLTFNSLVIIFVGYHLLKHCYYKLIVLMITLGVVLSTVSMLHYSLVPACPSCYVKYIVGKQIEFSTPFMKYIKN